MDRTPRQAIELRGVSKRFGNVPVLKNVTLSVAQSEVLTLLGPSGSGKSTILNLIAGFFPPDAGDIVLDGNIANEVPTHRRNLGMVFQNYSLLPHLSVANNVAFGLTVRNRPRAEIQQRVHWALGLVHLTELADRFPAQLSGGQQQRIAVARALVVNPSVLLYDEPLSNLDAKLRKELQVELRRIHRDTGTTTLYVTHDQEEAITMADRVALVNGGVIEQLGDPRSIFEYPRTRFVAEFMGYANFLTGRLEARRDNACVVVLGDGSRLVSDGNGAAPLNSQVTLCIRDERVLIEPAHGGSHLALPSAQTNPPLPGIIKDITYTGTAYVVFVVLQTGAGLRARVPVQQLDGQPPEMGGRVNVLLPRRDLRALADADV